MKSLTELEPQVIKKVKSSSTNCNKTTSKYNQSEEYEDEYDSSMEDLIEHPQRKSNNSIAGAQLFLKAIDDLTKENRQLNNLVLENQKAILILQGISF